MKLTLVRLTAYGLDFIMLAVVLVGFQLAAYHLTGGFPFDRLDKGYQIECWVLATMSFPVWLYFIVSEYFFGATLGKKLLRLSVTRRDGGRISFIQAAGRTCLKLLPWELTHLIVLVPDPWWSIQEPPYPALVLIPNGMILLYIVFLLLNRGKRALHDIPAGTSVRHR
ncbi:RDD family protein [Paenibacillus sp. Y412MC10]|uniref:RDD family protein n=1 Tax=Geobacillus sp. (strain Y412MC10) TaxID=481743 RepID=UPI0011A22C22|nr:RDD family protein [Paenibacillus sp. Y412MC10]